MSRLSLFEAAHQRYEELRQSNQQEQLKEEFKNDDIFGIAARLLLIDASGNYLMDRRPPKSKLAKNKLQLVGGKFNIKDRNRKAAIAREISEELKIHLSLGAIYFLFANTNEDGYQTFFFVAQLEQTYTQEIIDGLKLEDQIEVVPADTMATLIAEGEIAFDHPQAIQKAQVLLGK